MACKETRRGGRGRHNRSEHSDRRLSCPGRRLAHGLTAFTSGQSVSPLVYTLRIKWLLVCRIVSSAICTVRGILRVPVRCAYIMDRLLDAVPPPRPREQVNHVATIPPPPPLMPATVSEPIPCVFSLILIFLAYPTCNCKCRSITNFGFQFGGL